MVQICLSAIPWTSFLAKMIQLYLPCLEAVPLPNYCVVYKTISLFLLQRGKGSFMEMLFYVGFPRSFSSVFIKKKVFRLIMVCSLMQISHLLCYHSLIQFFFQTQIGWKTISLT